MTVSPENEGWVPDACTLPTAQQPTRIAEFDRLFAESARTARRMGPGRLELVLDPVAEPVARDLAARESSCCSFFSFDFATTEAGLVMGVGVPDTYADVLDAFAARADAAIGGPR
ncbi:hypothetical protein SAMN04244553_1178 [Nocardia amikacinitolerans]|uniref:Arsenate reductase n=1 Tax=Nocardia amikacinitolerans TaxID=756689 RepID=A0A285KZL0_9NOCA|nr:hypothetical protein [Nocardia amikacinitolerans]SNY78075.1 hypothetical protein SAMN04244553_1178 [Nocardia amikacinitolerans]